MYGRPANANANGRVGSTVPTSTTGVDTGEMDGFASSSAAVAPLPSQVAASSSSRTFFGVGTTFNEPAILEQSPAARSIKAPSEPPSEFSSWHDDGSSSLATCTGQSPFTITVNTQRVRMGEHLKGKLSAMITQRFENYLRIIHTFQNNIGKLEALECELRIPSDRDGGTSPARISISCNEDGTFLVYMVPDVSATLAGSNLPSSGGSGASAEPSESGKEASPDQSPDASLDVSPEAATLDVSGPAVSSTAAVESTASAPAETSATASAACGSPAPADVDLLRRWVQKVCEFGMSGRCHSLTALFHFGYNTWKQLSGDDRLVGSSIQGGAAGQIVEEDDGGKHREDFGGAWEASLGIEEDVGVAWGTHVLGAPSPRMEPAPGISSGTLEDHSGVGSIDAGGISNGVAASSSSVAPASTSLPPLDAEETVEGPISSSSPVAAPGGASRVDTVAKLLEAARIAADCEHNRQALDSSSEGIVLARGSSGGNLGARIRRAVTPDVGGPSSSSAPVPTFHFSGGAASSSAGAGAGAGLAGLAASSDDSLGSVEVAVLLWQLLSLRASVQARLHKFALALQDAEEMVSLQPTGAEGYYWQSVSLQGMGHGQEALEALMSALEYEPQNPLFQQAFTSLFEEISTQTADTVSDMPVGVAAASGTRSVHRMSSRGASSSGTVLHRRIRGVGDALSTTTQATHLSSRSTTPTEVSAPLSRSSSDDEFIANASVMHEASTSEQKPGDASP